MLTPKPVPSVSIYWNRTRGHFLVQRTAPILTGAFAGTSGEFGTAIRIPAEEFDSRIASLILESLAGYQNNAYDKDAAPHHTDNEQIDFAKQHLLVHVAALPSGQIRVSACERRGGSYGGVKDGDMILDASSAVEELPRVIHEAFSKAT
jgi:hypothetical protein